MLLREGHVHKETAHSDFVVRRKLHLFQEGKCITYHDWDDDPNNKRSWYFSPQSELLPAKASEISPSKKLLRPPKTWAITAIAKSNCKAMQLVRASPHACTCVSMHSMHSQMHKIHLRHPRTTLLATT